VTIAKGAAKTALVLPGVGGMATTPGVTFWMISSMVRRHGAAQRDSAAVSPGASESVGWRVGLADVRVGQIEGSLIPH